MLKVQWFTQTSLWISGAVTERRSVVEKRRAAREKPRVLITLLNLVSYIFFLNVAYLDLKWYYSEPWAVKLRNPLAEQSQVVLNRRTWSLCCCRESRVALLLLSNWPRGAASDAQVLSHRFTRRSTRLLIKT